MPIPIGFVSCLQSCFMNSIFVAKEHTNKAQLIKERQFGATLEEHQVIYVPFDVLYSLTRI